ncbi:MAG: hypothetical protein JWM19_6692 [Actinomycetia bacterium]|nr:hypothetical protein [Actinomycetes bacterium]
MIEISDEYVIASVDGEIVATARRSWYATADGNGAWIVSTHPARLFTRPDARDPSRVPGVGARQGACRALAGYEPA